VTIEALASAAKGEQVTDFEEAQKIALEMMQLTARQ
jgi:hypothetical protein